MIPGLARGRKKELIPQPGDDEVGVPPPITEQPPPDSFCDLVLTGGVASGVVYPWAIVELARAYRFRNIGGTSVGAMAAALAAAAEYGRRCGYEASFETLRRSPASLARVLPDGRTRMLSLFQASERGKRLMRLWGKVATGNQAQSHCRPPGVAGRLVGNLICIYGRPALIGAVTGALLAKILACVFGQALAVWSWGSLGLVIVLTLVAAVTALILELLSDIRYGVLENNHGLCKGGTLERPDSDEGPSGLSEWLHAGVQRSAGLKVDDPPLTFQDLWTAPAFPGGGRQPCGAKDPAHCRSINLQMITTNVTHGRPYRLPLEDETSRLFFKPEELKDYFPPAVIKALVDAGRPYEPRGSAGVEPAKDHPTAKDLLELPIAKLPLVVAARLSLSFPVLFSAVPLWAIDYEAPRDHRLLRRCMFTDGGASSNFPIHLFDEAIPRWPTFGLWLDRRPPYWRKDDDVKGPVEVENEVWLPDFNEQGRGDSWDRFDPDSKPPLGQIGAKAPCPPSSIRSFSYWGPTLGFLRGIATSAADWHDRTSFRLPHVRNRVARLLLLPGEGGLHIGMPRAQILDMAHRYGTVTGQKFVDRFAVRDGKPSPAWTEQRWIRFNLLANGLRERLDGLAASAAWTTRSEPLRRVIADAVVRDPVRRRGRGKGIQKETTESVRDLLGELEQLEAAIRATPEAYGAEPRPEMRLCPPL